MDKPVPFAHHGRFRRDGFLAACRSPLYQGKGMNMEHVIGIPVDVLGDTARRRALYLAMMSVVSLFEKMPGGKDAALVGMAVALGSMAEEPVNVSTVADMVGIDRKKARRLLDVLVEHGFVHKKAHRSGWSVYERSLDLKSQTYVQALVDGTYSILRKHLFEHCAAAEHGEGMGCRFCECSKARGT